jgi:Concanavalin A-like lectin/glucanases superfamily
MSSCSLFSDLGGLSSGNAPPPSPIANDATTPYEVVWSGVRDGGTPDRAASDGIRDAAPDARIACPPLAFCDDFESLALASYWDEVEGDVLPTPSGMLGYGLHSKVSSLKTPGFSYVVKNFDRKSKLRCEFDVNVSFIGDKEWLVAFAASSADKEWKVALAMGPSSWTLHEFVSLGGTRDRQTTLLDVPPMGTWAHLAFEHEGSNVRVFRDGNLKGAVTDAIVIPAAVTRLQFVLGWHWAGVDGDATFDNVVCTNE